MTLSTKTSESSRSPSLTVTEIFTLPFQSSAGVSINCSPIISAATFTGSSLITLNDKSSPSISVASNVSTNGVSSSVTWTPISGNTGASGTELIVSTKVSSAVRNPSLTDTVILAVPK